MIIPNVLIVGHTTFHLAADAACDMVDDGLLYVDDTHGEPHLHLDPEAEFDLADTERLLLSILGPAVDAVSTQRV